MGDVVEVIQIRCRWCLDVFALCERCFRGQAYCSSTCRRAGTRRRQRAANARRQRSDEGRENHRDNQREHRARRRALANAVTDRGSATPSASSNVPPAGSTAGEGSTKYEEHQDTPLAGARSPVVVNSKREELRV